MSREKQRRQRVCRKSNATSKESDSKPAKGSRRATQRQPSAVQSTRGASVADAEAPRADAGSPGADAVQERLTQGQCGTKRG